MEQTIQQWQAIANNRGLVEFTAGMFHRLAVHVVGRDERLTVVHQGNRVELLPGGEESACDFGVTIDTSEADRLADEAQRPELGQAERFRIMRALFTSATEAMLRRRPFSSPLLKRLAGAESVIHARLISPTADEPDAAHTLIWADRQWIVIPGLHGRAARRFDMTVAQAAEYQRQAHRVLAENTVAGWIRFARWYRGWRNAVSTKAS